MGDKNHLDIRSLENEKVVFIRRWTLEQDSGVIAICNFGQEEAALNFPLQEEWHKLLDSAETQWSGPGNSSPTMIKTGQRLILQPNSLVVYSQKNSSGGSD